MNAYYCPNRDFWLGKYRFKREAIEKFLKDRDLKQTVKSFILTDSYYVIFKE